MQENYMNVHTIIVGLRWVKIPAAHQIIEVTMKENKIEGLWDIRGFLIDERNKIVDSIIMLYFRKSRLARIDALLDKIDIMIHDNEKNKVIDMDVQRLMKRL